MARKAKRRPFYRPRPQQRSEDAAHKRQRVDAEAQALLANRTPEQLRQELSAREQLLAEADRIAQLDPNPASLSRYRLARSEFEAARAALELLSRQPRTSQEPGDPQS